MQKPAAFIWVILAPAAFLAQTPQRVLDINPGAPGSSPFTLKVINNQMLFQAYEPAQGRQIWVSDGTAGGTHVLKTVVSPQFASGIFSPFFPYGDFVFFWARDGVQTTLWRTDASPGGTQALFTTSEYAAGQRRRRCTE